MRPTGDPRSAAPRLVLLSIDGLCSGDEAALRRLPHFRALIQGGFWTSRVEGIYPSQTYPTHATVVTGCYPEAHGIPSNTLPQPGRRSPDWFWYHRYKKAPSLYGVAHEAGLRVGIVFWPTAAGAAVSLHIPELKPTRPWHSLPLMLLANGTPLYLLHMLMRFGYKLVGIHGFQLDEFTTAAAAHALRRKRPELLLVHLMDLDHQRHRHGAASREAEQALEAMDRRLAALLAALEQAGTRESTAVVILGDHGHRDVRHRVNLNAAFRKAGLRISGPRWQAWANSCEGSAHVYLRPRNDRGLRAEAAEILRGLAQGGEPVVGRIFQASAIHGFHLGNGVDLVAEARRGYTFDRGVRGPVIREARSSFRSVHGYLPDADGYRPVFFGAGRGLPDGRVLPAARLVDVGPTLAALLGLELPEAQGAVLGGILDGSSPA